MSASDHKIIPSNNIIIISYNLLSSPPSTTEIRSILLGGLDKGYRVLVVLIYLLILIFKLENFS